MAGDGIGGAEGRRKDGSWGGIQDLGDLIVHPLLVQLLGIVKKQSLIHFQESKGGKKKGTFRSMM